MRFKWLALGYAGWLGLYSIYSYTQVDPNLVLSSRPWFWQWQQTLWNIGYHQRFASSIIYLIIVLGIFVAYGLILRMGLQGKLSFKRGKFLVGLAIVVLFVAYPALSHDVFNYLMNAKMVWVYHANPHVQVALDFPQDPWIKFMHNVHTPAPYAYGWTGLSLLPSYLGQNHLKVTLWLFKLMMIGAFLLLLKAQYLLLPQAKKWLVFAFGLNPLVLIETVGNAHNDVVMMAFLFWAVLWFKRGQKRSRWWWGGALLLYLLSVSIKYASLMFLAALGAQFVLSKWPRKISPGGLQAIAHYLPLLSAQSQRFLPWYLIWSGSFAPLTTESWLQVYLLLSSLCGLFAYIPYLYTGEYTPLSLEWRTMILFIPPLSYVMTQSLIGWIRRSKT